MPSLPQGPGASQPGGPDRCVRPSCSSRGLAGTRAPFPGAKGYPTRHGARVPHCQTTLSPITGTASLIERVTGGSPHLQAREPEGLEKSAPCPPSADGNRGTTGRQSRTLARLSALSGAVKLWKANGGMPSHPINFQGGGISLTHTHASGASCLAVDRSTPSGVSASDWAHPAGPPKLVSRARWPAWFGANCHPLAGAAYSLDHRKLHYLVSQRCSASPLAHGGHNFHGATAGQRLCYAAYATVRPRREICARKCQQVTAGELLGLRFAKLVNRCRVA